MDEINHSGLARTTSQLTAFAAIARQIADYIIAGKPYEHMLPDLVLRRKLERQGHP